MKMLKKSADCTDPLIPREIRPTHAKITRNELIREIDHFFRKKRDIFSTISDFKRILMETVKKSSCFHQCSALAKPLSDFLMKLASKIKKSL